MGFWVVRRTKRLWSDEEKRSICLQTTVPEVSVAQVARRYALNANMIFKWLRDARYAPRSAQGAVDAPVFLPVEIVNTARAEAARPILPSNVLPDCLLEIEIAGGHRLRVSGAYDPEALARLIRGLSG
jgi:transposase